MIAGFALTDIGTQWPLDQMETASCFLCLKTVSVTLNGLHIICAVHGPRRHHGKVAVRRLIWPEDLKCSKVCLDNCLFQQLSGSCFFSYSYYILSHFFPSILLGK